jgi:hypothetical protein
MTRSRCAPHRGAVVRPFVRLSVGLVSAILVSLFSGSATLQASLVWSADPANYGYLWQYSLAPPLGAEACGPTSTTNAFTFLQNTQGGRIGTQLTGDDYGSWKTTAETLANDQYMKTENGTNPKNLAIGMENYVRDKGVKIQFDGLANPDTLASGLPKWVKHGSDPVNQFYDWLSGGSGVVIGLFWEQFHSGHVVTVAGMDWNDINGDGIVDPGEATLSIIDPLDPSSNVENGNQGEPYGADRLTPQRAMFTTLDVWQGEYALKIRYSQYQGSDQISGERYGEYNPEDYADEKPVGEITFAFSMRAVPEPTSVFVWSTLVLGVTLTRRRRMA